MPENEKVKNQKVPEKKKHNESHDQQTVRSASSTSPPNASSMTQDDNSKGKSVPQSTSSAGNNSCSKSKKDEVQDYGVSDYLGITIKEVNRRTSKKNLRQIHKKYDLITK